MEAVVSFTCGRLVSPRVRRMLDQLLGDLPGEVTATWTETRGWVYSEFQVRFTGPQHPVDEWVEGLRDWIAGKS